MQPLFTGRLIIKLIKISFHLQSRAGSGFNRPLYILYKALARVTDLINRIVQVLKKDLYWVKISTQNTELMELVKP